MTGCSLCTWTDKHNNHWTVKMTTSDFRSVFDLLSKEGAAELREVNPVLKEAVNSDPASDRMYEL